MLTDEGLIRFTAYFGKMSEYFSGHHQSSANCLGAQYRQAWMECQARREIHTNKNGTIAGYTHTILLSLFKIRKRVAAATCCRWAEGPRGIAGQSREQANTSFNEQDSTCLVPRSKTIKSHHICLLLLRNTGNELPVPPAFGIIHLNMDSALPRAARGQTPITITSTVGCIPCTTNDDDHNDKT
jgi:hypothetical protein